MRTNLVAGFLFLVSLGAFAQAPDSPPGINPADIDGSWESLRGDPVYVYVAPIFAPNDDSIHMILSDGRAVTAHCLRTVSKTDTLHGTCSDPLSTRTPARWFRMSLAREQKDGKLEFFLSTRFGIYTSIWQLTQYCFPGSHCYDLERNEVPLQSELSAPIASNRFAIADPDTMNLRPLQMASPAYPPVALRARIQGVVQLQILIDEQGTVMWADAVSGHPLLIPAAVNAVKQWRYAPYLVSGRRVQVATVVSVNFTLSK